MDLLLLAYDYDTNRDKFLRTNPNSKAGGQVEQAKTARRSGRRGSPPTRSNTGRPSPKRSMPRPTRP